MKLTRATLYRMIREELDSELPWDLRPMPLDKKHKPWPTSQEKETVADKTAPEATLDPALSQIIRMIERISTRLDVVEKHLKVKVKTKNDLDWGDTQE